jgi:hypothetical protein
VSATDADVAVIDTFLFVVNRVTQEPVQGLDDLGVVRDVALGLHDEVLEVLAFGKLSLRAAEVRN